MSRRRDIRRCALQALYQFDAANEASDDVLASLAGSPGGEDAHASGLDLANRAWAHRAEADAAVADLTPQWPTHRQPVIDRSLLRLAYYEMTSGVAPPKVAINEAVELAKEFSTEKSPMFVNGVLDKLFRRLREASAIPEVASPDDLETPGTPDAAPDAAPGVGATTEDA
jgi:N utilization substance protein B